MKKCFAAATFVLVSTLAVGAFKNGAPSCTALQNENFFEKMQYLTSTPMQCRGDCKGGISRVGRSIAVRVFANNLEADKTEAVKHGVSWALTVIKEAIGNEVDIQITETIDREYETKIIIFPVTDELDRALIKGGLVGLSSNEYVFFHREVLIEGGCSMTFFVKEVADKKVISLAYIFMSEDSLENPTDLDRCVLEEMTHAFGLFDGPRGSTSFIDHENVDLSGSRPVLSPKTNAMLQYLYSGHPMERQSFASYRDKICAYGR